MYLFKNASEVLDFYMLKLYEPRTRTAKFSETFVPSGDSDMSVFWQAHPRRVSRAGRDLQASPWTSEKGW